jgi:hypothetical protein
MGICATVILVDGAREGESKLRRRLDYFFCMASKAVNGNAPALSLSTVLDSNFVPESVPDDALVDEEMPAASQADAPRGMCVECEGRPTWRSLSLRSLSKLYLRSAHPASLRLLRG